MSAPRSGSGTGQGELSFRPGAPARSGPNVLSVGALVRLAHQTLDAKIGLVWVEGEVSNLRVGAAGHAFFTLKDDEAMLPVAMWRSTLERLRFRIQDGQSLRVAGRVGVFAKQGRFQMYADRAEPAGLGARMLELEQRKAKLAAMGLFEAARKRPLPPWPRTIGLVTSAHGAALHDILRVALRRCPTHFVLAAAVVQGDDAPRSLWRALTRLGAWPGIEVIIIGRGGGSTEDLWAFNDERLAHAIAACPVPVVSAVGHEVDVTICDLVADVRASTPSQAAELVVPDRRIAARRLDGLARRLGPAVLRHALDRRSRLEHASFRLSAATRTRAAGARAALVRAERALSAAHPRARIARDRRRLTVALARLVALGRARAHAGAARLAAATLRLREAIADLVPERRARLRGLTERLLARGHYLAQPPRLRLAHAAAALHALSPLAVLERGYAVVTTASGSVITDASGADVGETIHVRLRRGTLAAVVADRAHDPEDPTGP
jgi:exodeoxyribonuclease VII large subunit